MGVGGSAVPARIPMSSVTFDGHLLVLVRLRSTGSRTFSSGDRVPLQYCFYLYVGETITQVRVLIDGGSFALFCMARDMKNKFPRTIVPGSQLLDARLA